MKPLIKIIFFIAAFFASTFLLIKFTGILTIEHIENWLIYAKELSPIYMGGLIVLLLFADLFIAIPTLTVIILSGYFLGHVNGAIAALTGLMLAGVFGYMLSRYYGSTILNLLVNDEIKRNEAIIAFQKHGVVMILLSRAMPILPEVTACLSGMTKMPFSKFLVTWSISSVPYVLIASYAGSISSINNPKPAIYTTIGLSALLWVFWFFYNRAHAKSTS